MKCLGAIGHLLHSGTGLYDLKTFQKKLCSRLSIRNGNIASESTLKFHGQGHSKNDMPCKSDFRSNTAHLTQNKSTNGAYAFNEIRELFFL